MADFPLMIRELNKAGLSNNSLAFLLRVAHTSVNRWAKGLGEPKYTPGKELVRLYELECAKLNEIVQGHHATSEL